jgi:hypothetical protein
MQHNAMCRKISRFSLIVLLVYKFYNASVEIFFFLFVIILVQVFYLDAMFYRISNWTGKFAINLVWVNILCHCFRVDLEYSLPFVLYHFASVIASFHLFVMEL